MLRNRTLRLSARRACMHMPVHTQANPSAKKMATDMGRGAIRGRLLPRASTACSEATGKQGRTREVNRRACGQMGGISAPAARPPALCLQAAVVTCQGLSATIKRATCLCTHCCVVYPQHRCAFSSDTHKFLRVWLLSQCKHCRHKHQLKG